jgi:hypothetical protein
LFNSFLLSYKHQLYCWQVAPQQCLLPLEADNKIKSSLQVNNIINITEGKNTHGIETACCVLRLKQTLTVSLQLYTLYLKKSDIKIAAIYILTANRSLTNL